MIQNNSLSSQTKFDQNQIKNTEVKKIRFGWSIGQPRKQQISPKSDKKRRSSNFRDLRNVKIDFKNLPKLIN